MPLQKLKDLLNEQKVKYVVLSHSPAYTAQEIAATAHVPGKELAKTVMVKVDGEMTMVVLPASHQIDISRLKSVLGAGTVELADENEFRNRFPSCELGAMPPFGRLYGMKTFVDQTLAEDERIAFNAGTHTELMRMTYADYERTAEPVRLQFSDQSQP
jgi:Ala-tRNA(Pro) deacylase